MSEADKRLRRVQFYGVNDLATGIHVPRVAELVEQFDPMQVPTSPDDILELHNVQLYLEHGFVPIDYSEKDRIRARERIPQIHAAVAQFFRAIDNANFSTTVAGVGREYHGDFLDLLGRNKAFDRCEGAVALSTLTAAGVSLAGLLSSKKLVQAYDSEMREELRTSPRGAEQLIRKYLQGNVQGEVHLPPSFTSADARELLERYIDSETANSNYIGLIVTAKKCPEAGIDAKLRLRAKRRSDQMIAAFFDENAGIRTGCEVSISETQDEPVVFKMDTSEGLISRYAYSRQWLDESCDNSSILNNFVHLFGFVDRQALLVLPAYPAHLGVLEQIMGTTGKTEYKVGAAFREIDMSTLLQTSLYRAFLASKDIQLERVISWFFEEYLVVEFSASSFVFAPTGVAASYLEKVRQIFPEMESVAKQFMLFARDGELDRDLLEMEGEPVRYREIPSLLEGKYVYSSESEEIESILNLLFSDQSTLNYINEDLSADSTAELLLANRVAYDNFEDYQRPAVDALIRLGVIEDTGTRVQFVNLEQCFILEALFTTHAASYYHLSDSGRAEVEAMITKGWVTRRSSLLTESEAKYFNYFLNNVDFSSGPQLRNKYSHGSQTSSGGEDAHSETYLIALRLTVALVIKINDDFCLAAAELARKRKD
ncbi:MAG: hypothetical protein ACOH14_09485 [Rhodoglobus sp.]